MPGACAAGSSPSSRGGTALLVLVSGLAITDAERGEPGATISGFGDGVWWALATITTVGYGDRYPVTTVGRVVAAGLMVAGIALLGIVTATLASWFVERIADDGASQQAATRAQVDALTQEVRALRAALDAAGPREAQDAEAAAREALAASPGGLGSAP